MEIFNYLRQHMSLVISILALLVSIIAPILRYYYKTTRAKYLELKAKTIEDIFIYSPLIHGNCIGDDEFKKEAQNELRVIAAKWSAYSETRRYFHLLKKNKEKYKMISANLTGLSNGLNFRETTNNGLYDKDAFEKNDWRRNSNLKSLSVIEHYLSVKFYEKSKKKKTKKLRNYMEFFQGNK